MVLVALEGSGVGDDVEIQFNGDTSASYGNTISIDGGADSGLFTTAITDTFGVGSSNIGFYILWIDNNPAGEKLVHKQFVSRNGSGSGIVPRRVEQVSKWTNQSDQITSIQFRNTGPGDLTFGEAVVLGWDPGDQESPVNNFWQELFSPITLTTESDQINSGVFSAKKYMWLKVTPLPSGSITPRLRVGNTTIDTGFNYSNRQSANGGADSTASSTDQINLSETGTYPYSIELFIVNFSTKEKLMWVRSIGNNSPGAGFTPTRIEAVSKWSDIINQINTIRIFNDSSGDFARGSKLEGWGHD